DRYVKYFSCWQQFISLLYAQIRGKDSLRDIETSLRTQSSKWYHLGIKDIKRSTLSDANKHRDWRVYEELFYRILGRCKDITPKHKFRFNNPLYTLDATVVELCLSLYPWAKFRKRKGALKIHNLYDHSGCIPTFMVITEGRRHDVKVAKGLDLPLMADSIVSVDRAYIDYNWLNSLSESGVYFVTRAKKNISYEIIGQHEVNKKKGLLSDYTIKLKGYYQSRYYPQRLRLVGFHDPETNKQLVFLTNNFLLSAYTITQIFKARWKIEEFFRWIKQNLKIKSFLGTSKNAVLTQIWIAMCYYLLLSYIKYQTKYSYTLTEFAIMLKETVFERISLIDLLSCTHYTCYKAREPDLQLLLL
ncbi:MAG: IS4 family transposase, partial [Thermodesulfobacteriota bacterium]